MSFPGEWVFAGGEFDDAKDLISYDTAIREFREETGYEGPIHDGEHLRSATARKSERIYSIDFFAARIDDSMPMIIRPEGEMIDHMWIRPIEAIRYISSKEFGNEQQKEFKRYGIKERQFPIQTIETLKYINRYFKM